MQQKKKKKKKKERKKRKEKKVTVKCPTSDLIQWELWESEPSVYFMAKLFLKCFPRNAVTMQKKKKKPASRQPLKM